MELDEILALIDSLTELYERSRAQLDQLFMELVRADEGVFSEISRRECVDYLENQCTQLRRFLIELAKLRRALEASMEVAEQSGPKGRFCLSVPEFSPPEPDPAPSRPAPSQPVPYPDAPACPCVPDFAPTILDRPAADIRKVQFSAVAPRRMERGCYAIVNVVMYENGFRSVVDDILRDADDPLRETRSGALKVQIGSAVKVCLTAPDISIEDSEQTLSWQGDYLNFCFAVSVPEHYQKSQILFSANVYIDDLIVTKLKFIAQCLSPQAQNMSVTREDVTSAFVSYARQDRNRVAAIIQGMRKIRPDLDVFFDVESLRSGDDWESALHREIERRDVLFLCWSHYAQQSRWVEKEWRYALERKGLSGIEPVPIEPPDACPPPEELRQKHFNDKLLYIINS